MPLNHEKSKLVIRPYKPEDKSKLLEIYELNWGKIQASKEGQVWDWKYHLHPYIKDSPFSPIVAELDQQPIGFLGSFPIKLKIGKQLWDGHWVSDFMVHPKHRGIAGIVLSKTFIETDGTILGQVGDHDDAVSYQLWCKLAKQNILVTRMPHLVKRLNIQGMLMDRTGLAGLSKLADRFWWFFLDLPQKVLSYRTEKNVRIVTIQQFTEAESGLLETLMAEADNIPLRDKAYLNWRYFQRPNTEYKVMVAYEGGVPKGFVVSRCADVHGKLNGRIVDLMAIKANPMVLRTLLREAVHDLRASGARIVEMYGSHREDVMRVLSRQGFRLTKTGAQWHPILGKSPSPNFYEGPWHISLSDGDCDRG